MNQALLFVCLGAAAFSGCARRDLHFSKTMSGQAVMMGCLNPGSTPGSYVLTDYKTSQPVPVTGHGDLKLHASNHAVKLVGSYKDQAEGLSVVRIDHIAASCKSPFPANLPQSAAQRP